MNANLIERALWTGIQTALGLLTVEGLSQFDVTALESLQVAGVAMVLSALKTIAVERMAALKAEGA